MCNIAIESNDIVFSIYIILDYHISSQYNKMLVILLQDTLLLVVAGV